MQLLIATPIFPDREGINIMKNQWGSSTKATASASTTASTTVTPSASRPSSETKRLKGYYALSWRTFRLACGLIWRPSSRKPKWRGVYFTSNLLYGVRSQVYMVGSHRTEILINVRWFHATTLFLSFTLGLLCAKLLPINFDAGLLKCKCKS